MKKIWVNKARSFQEAEEFDRKYYLEMSREGRLETVQILREMLYKIKGAVKHARRKRFQRVIRIIQQA